MQIDFYTKIVLSLIAAALWGLLLVSFLEPENVSATSKVVDVNIVEINNRPVQDSDLPPYNRSIS
jgi:hypothetical protein